jgi:hypothetical protein
LEQSGGRDLSIYSGFKLCPGLLPKQACFVLERYNEGMMERIVHEHVPALRISQAERVNLLRALVIGGTQRSDDELQSIIGYYLNSRGRSPERRPMPIRTEYPEVGVFRTYCGTNTIAWCDAVVSASNFRVNAR